MGKITKIEDQKNKKRFNIFVDDSFFCGLNKETAVLANLAVGKDIDENKLKQLIFDSEVKMAFDKAISLLSSKPYFKNEIKQKLLQKNYEKEVVNMVLNKLEDYKYIDDESLAKHYVQINSKYSKKILKQKLMEKGVSKNVIESIFEENNESDDEGLCLKLMQKYLKNKSIENLIDKNKLFSRFYQKGFDIDVIKRCFEKCKIIVNDDE